MERSQVELSEIIGEGQFGDVHKGSYTDREGAVVPVAVKTCKPDSDILTGEKFLEEACKLCCKPFINSYLLPKEL